MGFVVTPTVNERRADIIQTICLNTSENLCAYVRGIQKYSPVDSYVTPEPSPMPGYDSKIIMASGGFVAGSSIELSADAPLRERFSVFQQGGLSRYEVIYAVTNTLRDMKKIGLI
jgi:cystathionine beta-lyase family protein involved in aluminum resistance